MTPGQKFEIVQLADGRVMYHLIMNEDGQTAPAHRLGGGATLLNDLSTPARAHAATQEQEPITNTWSDAAREASIEARRARAGSKDQFANTGLAELSNHAEQLSNAAGKANTAQAHYAAAKAHRAAAAAYDTGPKNLDGVNPAAAAHRAAAIEHEVVGRRMERALPSPTGVARNAALGGDDKPVKPPEAATSGSAEAASAIEEHANKVAPTENEGGEGGAKEPKMPEPPEPKEPKEPKESPPTLRPTGQSVAADRQVAEFYARGGANNALPSDKVSPDKACQILHDGTAQGHPLSDDQRRMFGAACGNHSTHNTMIENELCVFAQILHNGATWNAAVSEQGGSTLHPDNFAYVPDPKKPSTWKLRIDDAQHVGGAIAAIGKGFRGKKASIPASDLGKVKAKIRAAWHKFHGKDEPVPAVLNERKTMPEITQAQRLAFNAYESRWTDDKRQAHFQAHPDDFAGPDMTWPITNRQDLDHAMILVNHAPEPATIFANIMKIAERRKLLDIPTPTANSGGASTNNPQPTELPLNTQQIQQLIDNCSCAVTKANLQALIKNDGATPEAMDDASLKNFHDNISGKLGRAKAEMAKRASHSVAGGGGAAAPLPADSDDAADQGFSFPGEGAGVANDGNVHSFDTTGGNKGGVAQAGGAGKKTEYPADVSTPTSEQNNPDKGGTQNQFSFPGAPQPQPQARPAMNSGENLLAQAERELAALPGVSPMTRALLMNAARAARQQETAAKYAIVKRMVVNERDPNVRNAKGNLLMRESLQKLEMLASLMPQAPVANTAQDLFGHLTFNGQPDANGVVPVVPNFQGAAAAGNPAMVMNEGVEVNPEHVPVVNWGQEMQSLASPRLLAALNRKDK